MHTAEIWYVARPFSNAFYTSQVMGRGYLTCANATAHRSPTHLFPSARSWPERHVTGNIQSRNVRDNKVQRIRAEQDTFVSIRMNIFEGSFVLATVFSPILGGIHDDPSVTSSHFETSERCHMSVNMNKNGMVNTA